MHRSNKGPQQNNPTNNSFLINFCFLFLFWYISVTTNTISFIYVATSVHKVNNNLGVREMKNTPACLKIFSALLLLTSLLYILIAPSSPSIHENLQPQQLHFDFEFCPDNYTNHCPCQDPMRQRRFPKAKMFRKERHCPQSNQRLRCLIPTPTGYQTPFPWPKSKDTAWFSNVPFPKLVEYKKSQNWVRLEGNRFVFPGGGTSFPEGVKAYVNALKRLLPVPLESGDVRTVLDVGCGVSELVVYLMLFRSFYFSFFKNCLFFILFCPHLFGPLS